MSLALRAGKRLTSGRAGKQSLVVSAGKYD